MRTETQAGSWPNPDYGIYFCPYSPTLLEALLSRFSPPPVGVEYLMGSLEAPSRSIRSTPYNKSGDHKCPKMDCTLQFESTADSHATVDYILDPDIGLYLTHPQPLPIRFEGKNRRVNVTTFTPNFVVGSFTSGFSTVEWLPASKRDQLINDHPGRYAENEAGVISSIPAIQAARELGFTHQVRFSDELSSSRFRNLFELRKYLYEGARNMYRDSVLQIEKILSAESFIPLMELTKRIPGGVDAVKCAIATSHAHIDLDSHLLSQPQEVLVFRDRTSLAIYKETMGMSIGAIVPRSFNGAWFTEGTIVVLDGRRMLVKFGGRSEVYFDDENQKDVRLSLRLLETAFYERKLTIDGSVCAIPQALQQTRLRGASKKDQDIALRRVAILRKIRTGVPLTADEHYSAATIRRWSRGSEQAAGNGFSPLEGVLPCHDRQGFRTPRIRLADSEYLTLKIKELLGSTETPTSSQRFLKISALFEKENRQMVGRSSYYEREAKLKQIDVIRESVGHKGAHPFEPQYLLLNRETPVHSNNPFEHVHIDHTLLELRVCSSISGEDLARVWLTIAIDDYSRKVLGFYLSFFPPSYISVMMVLLDVLKRSGRVPDGIIHDWGSEFGSKDLYFLLGVFDIWRWQRPKGSPRFGSVGERIFGTHQDMFAHGIVGNTKRMRNVRTISAATNPSLLSGATLMDTHYGCEDYFGAYNNKKHPAHMRTPNDRENEGLVIGGSKTHRLFDIHAVLQHFLPTARPAKRVIDSSRGVYCNYEWYGHEFFRDRALNGKAVDVKPNPTEPGKILVYVNKQWVECRSKWYSELEAVPEFMRRALFEEYLFERNLLRKDNHQFGLKVSEIIDRVNAAAQSNRNYLRDDDTRRLAAAIGSPASMPADESADDNEDTSRELLAAKFSRAIQAAQQAGDIGSRI